MSYYRHIARNMIRIVSKELSLSNGMLWLTLNRDNKLSKLNTII